MNIRNALTLLLLLCSTPFLFSQTTWSNEYFNQTNDRAVKILANTDDTFTVLGQTSLANSNNDRSIWLYSINAEGSVIWNNTIEMLNLFDAIEEIIAIGNENWILSSSGLYNVDASGNLIQTFPLTNARDVLHTSDGHLMVLSYATPLPLGFPRVQLTKMDVQGNVVFEQVYDDDQSNTKVEIAEGLIETSNGDFIIFGNDFSDYNDFIYRVDANGNQLWKQTFEWGPFTGTFDAIETPDGDVIFNGFYADSSILINHLYRLDTDGNLVWQNDYSEAFNFEYKGGFIQTSDGNLVMITYENDPNVTSSTVGSDGFYELVKVNLDGDEIWRRTFGFSSTNLACAIVEANNQDLVVVGRQDNQGINGFQSIAFAERLTADGLLLPSCGNDYILLSTQAQVDAWPGCTSVRTLDIIGDDITDLSPLSSLVEAEIINISNTPNLTSLAGLENLSQVSLGLILRDAANLVDISALQGLTSIPNDIDLDNLESLTNLNGLQNLEYIRNLTLENNANLTDLSALSNLQEVVVFQLFNNSSLTTLGNMFSDPIELTIVEIRDNESLSDISAFQNVEQLQGLVIQNNPSLTTLNGLQNITTIYMSNLVISDNTGLINLNGLEGLTTVAGSFILVGNTNLQNVNALSNLMNVGTNFSFQNNTNLQECCGLYPLIEEGTVGGSTSIQNNGDCNSIFQITQVCKPDDCNEDVYLSSQEEVDNWLGCTNVVGTLTIDGDDITDLSPLSSLTSAGGLVITNCNTLTTLDGLENLTQLESLIMVNDTVLTDITALSNLTTVNGFFYLNNLNSLTTLDGFQNLTTVGTLYLDENDNLEDITALENLENIMAFQMIFNPKITSLGTIFSGMTELSSLQIIANEGLADISSLQNIEQLGSLTIAENPSLTSLSGLQSLISVENSFRISGMEGLTDLSGLENLSSINGSVNLEYNTNLQNVDALSNLLTIGGLFSFQMNPNLQSCCGLYPLFAEGTVGGNVTFQDNGSCNSTFELLQVCKPDDCNEDVFLSSQEEVDNWLGCTHVVGTLQIQGDDITDLSPLSTLERAGSLTIALNDNLTSLAGLENLTTIDDGLALALNTNLNDISALSNLTNIGDLLYILDAAITSLDGLQNLNSVGTLYLDDNDNLTDISALANLQEVNELQIYSNDELASLDNAFSTITYLDRLEIIGNTNLIDISSLENLQTIGEFGFVVFDNTVLSDLNGLQNLTTVEGFATISSNDGLMSLDGLDNLATVNGGFSVQGNMFLENVDALSNLLTVQGDFFLQENTSLTNCCGLYPLFTEGTITGSTTIQENATCNSVNEIVLSCQVDDCATSVYLASQEEVDNWLGCDSIFQTLTISGPDITDLSPLSNLEYVEGGIVIRDNPMLQSLDGLNNAQVGFTYVIQDNPMLTDITAMSGQTIMQGQLIIRNNDQLPSLDGLQNLTAVNDIIINDNDSLVDLSELNNIQTLGLNFGGGFIHIMENNSLTSINAFNQLTTIGNQVLISGNDNLTQLNAFQNVTSIGDVLVFADNINLISLDGLENLTSITNQLVLHGNGLENIDALSQLMSVGGSVDITNNFNLNLCCGVYPLFLTGDVGGVIDIFDNGEDCNSVNTILNVCQVDDCNLDVILESQEEVDNWLGCDEIVGTLRISGDDIVDLSPLSTLTQVGSIEIVNNASLASLNGLQNLEIIETNFIFLQNPQITNLEGLNAVTSVGGFFYIYENEQLISLDGFDNLTHASNVLIEDNPALASIEAFSNTNDIINFQLIGNPSLASLDGLEGQQNIETLFLISMDNLVNIDALSNLQTVSSNFVMANNPNLASLAALSNLTSTGLFVVSNISSLTSLDGLDNLMEVTNGLFVSDNSVLSSCCAIYPLLNEGTVIGNIGIENNQSPCDNQGQILGFCDDGVLDGVDLELDISSNFSQYEIYKDLKFTLTLTNDGTEPATNVIVNIPNSTEFMFPNDMVYTGSTNLTPNIPSEFEVVWGNWIIPILQPGETAVLELVLYTLVEDVPIVVSAQVYEQNEFDVDSSPNNNVASGVPTEDDEAIITIQPANDDTPIVDLELSMSTNILQAQTGDEITYTLALRNNGPDLATGIVINHLDFVNQSYVSHSLSGGAYDPSTNIWEVGNLGAGNTVVLNFTLSQDQLEDGEQNVLFFQVIEVDQNDKDSAPANAFTHNYGHEDDEIVYYLEYGLNDPISTNIDLELDLTVDDTNYTIFDYVTYTLTVTNTGTQAATGVKIDWKVPEGLAHHDAIVSSGDYFSWSGEWFIYEPIFAGESETIEFTVWTNVGGVEITSYAQVIEMDNTDMDSNVGNGECCTPNEDDEAVVTIGSTMNFANNGTIQNRSERTQFKDLLVHNVYPNPAVDQVNVTITTLQEEVYSYKIYDSQGNVVRRDQLPSGKRYHDLAIDINELPSGMYTIIFDTRSYHAPIRFMKQGM